jgi:hypothetical protein
MRLPDLRSTRSAPSSADPETKEVSETVAPSQQQRENVAAETLEGDQKSEDDKRQRSPAPSGEPSGARISAWRSSLWHLLIPIGLLVLFLAAWAVISRPGEDASGESAETEIEAPDIDTGELVSPEDLALEEFEPVTGAEASTDDQLSDAAPTQTPESSGSGPTNDATSGSTQDVEVDAPADLSSAPPLLEGSDESASIFPGHPSEQEQEYELAANPNARSQTPPNPEDSQQGFSYPTTDPTKYGYSQEADSTPSVQPPPANPYSYPTTGAPPLRASSGAAPGVQQR